MLLDRFVVLKIFQFCDIQNDLQMTYTLVNVCKHFKTVIDTLCRWTCCKCWWNITLSNVRQCEVCGILTCTECFNETNREDRGHTMCDECYETEITGLMDVYGL